jgi:hypothetical protein
LGNSGILSEHFSKGIRIATKVPRLEVEKLKLCAFETLWQKEIIK